MTISAKEVARARAYIFSRGLNNKDIPPRLLAITAKKLGKNLEEVVALIGIIKMRGQGGGASPLGSQFANDV